MIKFLEISSKDSIKSNLLDNPIIILALSFLTFSFV